MTATKFVNGNDYYFFSISNTCHERQTVTIIFNYKTVKHDIYVSCQKDQNLIIIDDSCQSAISKL